MYALVCTCVRSTPLATFFMRDKSARSVTKALQELMAFVAQSRPGTRMRIILGDNDTSWAVTGGGETTLTAEVDKWLRTLPEKERPGVRTTAPYMHQHVDVERSMWRLFMFMCVNLNRAGFTAKPWPCALRAACYQPNCLAEARGVTGRGPSRHEGYYGFPPDLSRMVGYFGQTVYMKIEGRRVGGGAPTSELGYFVCPAVSSSGWILRALGGDMRSGARFHFRLVDDEHMFAARLLASDELHARNSGLINPSAELFRETFRSLLTTGGEPPDALVYVDPLTGLPVELVAGTVEGRPSELIMWRKVGGPETAEQARVVAQPAIQAGVSPGRAGRAVRHGPGASERVRDAEARGLAIVFRQENPKQQSGASYGRYEKYKGATSFAALAALGRAVWQRKDLIHDVERGYASFAGDPAPRGGGAGRRVTFGGAQAAGPDPGREPRAAGEPGVPAVGEAARQRALRALGEAGDGAAAGCEPEGITTDQAKETEEVDVDDAVDGEAEGADRFGAGAAEVK